MKRQDRGVYTVLIRLLTKRREEEEIFEGGHEGNSLNKKTGDIHFRERRRGKRLRITSGEDDRKEADGMFWRERNERETFKYNGK